MKIVFLDRDGTFIQDPLDERVDREDKIELFPDREEVRRYMDTRISNILSEYLIPKKNFELYKDNLIKARQKRLELTNDLSLFNLTREYRLEIFKSAYDELKDMLENFDGYIESEWQEKNNGYYFTSVSKIY